MTEIRERLEAHWQDVLVLLQEVGKTAIQHTGFRLAGAVGHLARAQVLLAEELEGLPRGSEKAPVSVEGRLRDEEATPAEGIYVGPKRTGT